MGERPKDIWTSISNVDEPTKCSDDAPQQICIGDELALANAASSKDLGRAGHRWDSNPWRLAWTQIRAREKSSEFANESCFDVSGIKIGVNYAIADAGATGHFLVPEAPVINKAATTNPLSIHLPDGEKLMSTHTCEIDVPSLPKGARKAHIVPGLAHSSLISIKALCDEGCKVKYDDEYCKVYYNDEEIWTGIREPSTGLWVLPLDGRGDPVRSARQIDRPRHAAHNVHHLTSRQAVVRFLHQCLFSPPKLTLIKASTTLPN